MLRPTGFTKGSAVNLGKVTGRNSPGHNIPGTPEQYASTIFNFSERRQDSFLHPGSHYRQLAKFLSSGPALQPRSFGVEPRQHFVHIVVHELHANKERQKYMFDELTGLQDLERLPLPAADTGRIVFIRGNSHRDWVLPLSAKYRIDPEYLRRHLDFSPFSGFYDLPPLLSSTRGILQLRLTTIFTRQLPLTAGQLHQARRGELEQIQKHQRQLGATGVLGESVGRKLSIHSEAIFTLEQNISICLKRKQNGSWTAFVWLDAGRDLSESSLSQELSRGGSPSSNPVILHRPKGALAGGDSEHLPNGNAPAESMTVQEISQHASLLPFQYGSTLNPAEAAAHPQYALSDLFNSAAASECQFLNMMQGQIAYNLSFLSSKMDLAVNNLKHSKTVLDEHVQLIRQTIAFLNEPELCDWSRPPPGATGTSSGQDLVDKTWKILVFDFEDLSRRAQTLATQCLEGVNMIMNSAMLAESQKAIEKQEKMTRLTILAYFFLPLSLTTSVFGMNIKQMGSGEVDMYWLFVILVPVLMGSIAICFWSSLSKLLLPWKFSA